MSQKINSLAELSCPAPLPKKETVVLGHGSGGRLSAELMRSIFLPAFENPVLARLDDQAIVRVNGTRLAITTDSFVVKPLFFRAAILDRLQFTERSTIWRWAEPSRSFSAPRSSLKRACRLTYCVA